MNTKQKSIRENPFIDDAIYDIENIMETVFINSSKEDYAKFLLIHSMLFLELRKKIIKK